jgi:hypothetical protein
VGRFDRLHHWQVGALLAVAATLLLPALLSLPDEPEGAD